MPLTTLSRVQAGRTETNEALPGAPGKRRKLFLAVLRFV